MNNEPISKISELTFTATAQTTASLIGFHLASEFSLSKDLLSVTVAVQLVAFYCGLMSMLLAKQNAAAVQDAVAKQNAAAVQDAVAKQNAAAVQVFDNIAMVCYTLGHILMVAMFVRWWLVLIITLFFGVLFIFLVALYGGWLPYIQKLLQGN